ncbi:unnamed protein product [Blepharisma stoltei]|uniref:Uncharacterized protein n=1 Tax=Blepharisma stoltei TaxID=1481888 RepID=A0AAU9INK7_9CILI|nr:unnamed protein product [Blepharisma stoltei]
MGNTEKKHIVFQKDSESPVSSSSFRNLRKNEEANKAAIVKKSKEYAPNADEESENQQESSDSSKSNSNLQGTAKFDQPKRVRIIPSEEKPKLSETEKMIFRKKSREFEKWEFSEAVKAQAKHVDIIDQPTHRDTSTDFQKQLHEFEANEFNIAKKLANEQTEKAPPKTVKVIGRHRHSFSSNFAKKTKEFEKEEYTNSRRASIAIQAFDKNIDPLAILAQSNSKLNMNTKKV